MLFHTKPNSPRVIYLDQNKWIDLALAYHQQPRGARFTATLLKIQAAVQQQAARFPLSDIHIIETMKMGDRARRQRLAHMMAELSEGWTIAPPEQINSAELQMAIPAVLGRAVPIVRPQVFGRGIEFAFGQPIHTPAFVSALCSSNAEKRKLALHFLGLLLQSPDEQLRKPGIDHFHATMNALAGEADQIRNLVRDRSKDVQQRAFAARFVYEHFRDRPDELRAILAPLGISLDEFFATLGKVGLAQLFADMPTADVALELRQQRHRQYDKVIEPNDLNDLSFLSVAIPYCDIVVTERQWVDLAKRKHLDQKYQTALISDLADLEHHL